MSAAVVIIDTYAYLVPYVEHNEEILLKTIIPSGKDANMHVREKIRKRCIISAKKILGLPVKQSR